MIETPRLRLIKVSRSSRERFRQINFSADMMKFITGRPLSFTEAVDRYSFSLEHLFFGAYFVENPGTNQIIGLAVIKEKGNEVEIGYLVIDSQRGNGYATEICKGLIVYCKEKLPKHAISAYLDPGNLASKRVLEKCEMKNAGKELRDGMDSLKYIL